MESKSTHHLTNFLSFFSSYTRLLATKFAIPGSLKDYCITSIAVFLVLPSILRAFIFWMLSMVFLTISLSPRKLFGAVSMLMRLVILSGCRQARVIAVLAPMLWPRIEKDSSYLESAYLSTSSAISR